MHSAKMESILGWNVLCSLFCYCEITKKMWLHRPFLKITSLDASLFCALTLNLCDNITPNRSLDRKSATGNGKDYLLSSFIFLLASCFSLVLAVARYAFELT